MSNEIEMYSKLNDPLLAIDRMGEFFARSGMFGCDRSEQGKVLALICLVEKKSPVDITRSYDLINGKLAKKALAALADFRRAGGKHKWLKDGTDGKAAELQLTFEGETIVSRFTIEDAQRMGLVRPNSNWLKSPANMLRSRAISNGVAMLCPEIFAGDEPGEDAPAAPAELALPQAKAAKVIDLPPQTPPPQPQSAAAVPTPQPDEPQVATPTAAAAAPDPAPPFRAGPKYDPPKGPALPDDLCRQVEDAIGEHAQAAVGWMVKEGWLKAGDGVERLTEARARRIIKQRDSFLARVQEAA